MMLGALLDLGVERKWLDQLPGALGLEGVNVRAERVQRAGIAAWKVDFDIPPQPHGRHLKHIRAIVDASAAPATVRERANRAFELITAAEAAVHGTTVEKVHLHEVGSVDAILDVVGSVWGLHLLGVESVRCGTIALGDGFVDAAHGRMAVPAPAVVRLIEGFDVTAGPAGSGELTTPTGAVLMQALATPGLPPTFRPLRSGFGAGTKDFPGRANVLRVTLAEVNDVNANSEAIVVLACDVDDMTGEYLVSAAETLRAAGALDVILAPVVMKKGRPGTRVEVLCAPSDAPRIEATLLVATSTIGVRRYDATRTALPRTCRETTVFGRAVRVKVVTLPDGTVRGKPEFDDVEGARLATGRPAAGIIAEALRNVGLL